MSICRNGCGVVLPDIAGGVRSRRKLKNHGFPKLYPTFPCPLPLCLKQASIRPHLERVDLLIRLRAGGDTTFAQWQSLRPGTDQWGSGHPVRVVFVGALWCSKFAVARESDRGDCRMFSCEATSHPTALWAEVRSQFKNPSRLFILIITNFTTGVIMKATVVRA